MAHYVDGFLIPVPKRNLGRYKRIATAAARIWMEHGALQYMDCVGDDLDHKGIAFPFTKSARCKPGETVVFSFIVYRNRRQRDQVNKKVMSDPRMAAMMPDMVKNPPFDSKRMAYGGFAGLVEKGL